MAVGAPSFRWLLLGAALGRATPRAPSASAVPPRPPRAGAPPCRRRPRRGPVILFLVDNSASLPPLDPEEKRVAALEKMFRFLKGQPYRLILFGGRKEIFVDDASSTATTASGPTSTSRSTRRGS